MQSLARPVVEDYTPVSDRRPGQSDQRADLIRGPGYCEDRAFRPPEESCIFHFPGIQPDRLSESKGKCSAHLQAAAASYPGAPGPDKRRGKAQRTEALRRPAAACGYRTGSGQ